MRAAEGVDELALVFLAAHCHNREGQPGSPALGMFGEFGDVFGCQGGVLGILFDIVRRFGLGETQIIGFQLSHQTLGAQMAKSQMN